MKKIIVLLFAIFSTVFASALPLKNFNISLGGGATEVAGTTISIIIDAYDTNDVLKSDYSGPAGISVSIGDFVLDTGNSLTGVFVAGRWTGTIQLQAAALPVIVTCTDASTGAFGNASKGMTAGVFVKPLEIIEGMTWAPGTLTGYTGFPVTQTTNTPIFVTIKAVDAYNNTITSAYPTIKFTAPSNGHAIITPERVTLSVLNTASAIFTIALYPNPDTSAIYGLTAKDSVDSSKFDVQNVYFASDSDYYVWAEGPASAVAGKSFTVRSVISHAVFSTPTGESADHVLIAGVDMFGNSLDAGGKEGLNPINSQSGPFSNGIATFTVSYKKSSVNDVSGIKIAPVYLGLKSILESRLSNVIVIYADEPAVFTFGTETPKKKKNQISILNVHINDQYGNSVSNTAVDFRVVTGAGKIVDGAGNTSEVSIINTDVYGFARISTTSFCNTVTRISASVTISAAVQTKFVDLEFADIITNTEIRNYPNPFNPNEGPTTIEYYLDNAAKVSMKLYSFNGSTVWTKTIPAGVVGGYNQYVWNGITDRNMKIAAGLYTLKIEVDAAKKYTLTRKIAVKK